MRISLAVCAAAEEAVRPDPVGGGIGNSNKWARAIELRRNLSHNWKLAACSEDLGSHRREVAAQIQIIRLSGAFSEGAVDD